MNPQEKQPNKESQRENVQETRHPSDIDQHPIWEKEPDDVEEEESQSGSEKPPTQH